MTAEKAGNRFFLDRGAGFELVAAGSAPAAYPPHTHVSTVTLLMIRRGAAVLGTPGGGRALREGQTAVIHPHSLHSLAWTARSGALALCLDRSLFSPRLGQPCAAALGRFLGAAAEEGILSRSEGKALLALARAAGSGGADADDRLSRLRREMEAHPEEEMSLADMARRACVDKGHLIRSFRKRYGLAPAGFLRQNRLRRARRGLPESGSLTRAAVDAGFFDQSHFIRHFKRLYRMTPGQYLRALQHSGGKNLASRSSPPSPASTECSVRGANRETVPGA